MIERDYGYQKIEDVDLNIEKRVLEKRLDRKVSEEELVLYLQHPNDAVSFFKFEEKYGKVWVLPPKVWLKKGGFDLGDTFEFPDAYGKLHSIVIGPQRKTSSGDAVTYLVIDHHPEPILTELEQVGEKVARKVTLTTKEIEALAKDGDIRSPIKGNVNEVPVSEGEEVSAGQVLIVLEAMKMLSNILSGINGKIMEILKNPGDQVDVGDPLIIVKKAPEGEVGSHGSRRGKG